MKADQGHIRIGSITGVESAEDGRVVFGQGKGSARIVGGKVGFAREVPVGAEDTQLNIEQRKAHVVDDVGVVLEEATRHLVAFLEVELCKKRPFKLITSLK